MSDPIYGYHWQMYGWCVAACVWLIALVSPGCHSTCNWISHEISWLVHMVVIWVGFCSAWIAYG